MIDKDTLAELIRDLCVAQVKEGTLLHDFEAFLGYVEKENIKLTPKLEYIPLKHLRNITSLFRQPDPLEERIGQRDYKVRSEFELPRLHFIDLLAVASGCTRITGKGYYRKGPSLPAFRELDVCKKLGILLLSWWDNLPWEAYCPRGGAFAEFLRKEQNSIIPVLQKTLYLPEVDLEQFSDQVIAATGAKWRSQSGDPDNELARWGVEMAIIKAMSYFEAVKLVKITEEYGMKKTVAFSLTDPLGKWLVSILSCPPPPLVAS